MAHHTDHELLAEFVKNGSESAFSALVARYVNLVYSTALRHTSNPHHAEEVTQAVFIILARKAGSISSKVVLTGWLYQAARLNAANHRRDNQRRQQREQQAIMESALNVPADEPWKLIAPILDEAMNALGVTDRDAVLLRYFENKPLAEVGAALGVSEAAAEKRVSRALERLHAMLTRQGVALGATAIAGAITANAVQAAPAALAATITPAVLTATSLTSATVAMTTLQKIAVTAVLAATIGGGIYAAKQASDAHKEVQAQQAPMVEQIRQLQSSLTDATNRLTELTAENSELKSGKDKMEVLKLRGEVTAMRTRLASLQNGRLETTNGAGDSLHVRTFRINPRAFLEKADSALGHPVNSTPTQITADYFASKGINLEPPKSAYLNTSNALLIARATDPELNAIESLLAESTPAQINIKARFIEIPRQGFVMPSAIPGMKDNETTGVTAILGPAQFRVICKALEQREGVNLLTESSVLTLSGRQCQIRTGDDAAPGQPAASGPIVDLIPNLSADAMPNTNRFLSPFRALSDEVRTSKLFLCPTDSERVVGTSLSSLDRSNTSYFVSYSATMDQPQSILAGDRNITLIQRIPGVPRGVPSSITGAMRLFRTNSFGWWRDMHRLQGNLLLADGSVHTTKAKQLNAQIAAQPEPSFSWYIPNGDSISTPFP